MRRLTRGPLARLVRVDTATLLEGLNEKGGREARRYKHIFR